MLQVFFNGHPTLALPDTGSDLMLVSREYAQKLKLEVDWDFDNWLEVQFADGSTGWTSGVARNVEWTVDDVSIQYWFNNPVVAVINTVIAAVLLVGPIISLYFVKRDAVKLSILAAFTAAFAVSVGLVTSAKRAEIFGATAA